MEAFSSARGHHPPIRLPNRLYEGICSQPTTQTEICEVEPSPAAQRSSPFLRLARIDNSLFHVLNQAPILHRLSTSTKKSLSLRGCLIILSDFPERMKEPERGSFI